MRIAPYNFTMSLPPNRALLLSLALHLGVLALVTLPDDFSNSPVIPTVSLRGVLLPATQVTPAEKRLPAVLPGVLPRLMAPSASRQSVPPPPAAADADFAVLPAPTLAQPAHAPGSAGVSPAQEYGALTPDVLVAQTANPPAPPDPAGLRQFRLALAGAAREFRRYPEAARRAGLSGTAEVRIAVAAGGLARRAELARSSGNATLDQAALEMLRQALDRAVLPASLRAQSFTVLLPVLFEVAE